MQQECTLFKKKEIHETSFGKSNTNFSSNFDFSELLRNIQSPESIHFNICLQNAVETKNLKS